MLAPLLGLLGTLFASGAGILRLDGTRDQPLAGGRPCDDAHPAFGGHRDRDVIADRIRRPFDPDRESWRVGWTDWELKRSMRSRWRRLLGAEPCYWPTASRDRDHFRPDAGRTGPGRAVRSPHQSYFRLDDGTGMIRHSDELSRGPVTKLTQAQRVSQAWWARLGGLHLASTLGYHGEAFAGGLPAAKRARAAVLVGSKEEPVRQSETNSR